MKKMLKIVSMSLVFILSFAFITGCGCNKQLNIKYSIQLSNVNNLNVDIKATVIKKFREPGDTPCYKKVEDEYVLIEKAGGISVCYDKYGNEFEKATYANTDKVDIDSTWPTFEEGIYTNSTEYEMPEDSKHSLIFEFEIYNETTHNINIKEIVLSDIINDQLQEEAKEKVILNVSSNDINVIDGADYYLLKANRKFVFNIEFKGLKSEDLLEGINVFNLDLALTIK